MKYRMIGVKGELMYDCCALYNVVTANKSAVDTIIFWRFNRVRRFKGGYKYLLRHLR